MYKSPVWAGYLAAQRSKLPVMCDVENISDRVVRFLGCNPGSMQLQGTNTYLIGTGSSRILVDTGEGNPQWARNVTGYLEDHDISISDVLLTHWHEDHTGGLLDLLAHDCNIHVWKHLPDKGQLSIADNQVFRTQGATLTAVCTPGHSTDHTCFVLIEENALLTGDNVLGHGYSVAEDLEAYTASLRLMDSLNCITGYPGHGDVIRDLPHTIARYLTQRLSRENQIYSALPLESSSRGSSPCLDHVREKQADGVADGLLVCTASGNSEAKAIPGVSTSNIGNMIYGEVARDRATFDSAVVPILDQVLYMLLNRGRVGFRTVGPESIKHWFAVAAPLE